MEKSNPEPGNWQLFRIWASIGLQSFGGGASTSYLIYHTFVDKRGWLLPEEYNRFWNLCVMAPGINLVGLTILIGRKLGHTRGIFLSLLGLLLPSATITCLLTAGFLSIQNIPAVQAMLKGVVPATAGIMLVVGIKYAQPLLKELKAEGWLRVIAGLVLILFVALAIILWQVAIPLVLIGAALASILLFNRLLPSSTPVPAKRENEREAEKLHD
jgi:chromate transporter